MEPTQKNTDTKYTMQKKVPEDDKKGCINSSTRVDETMEEAEKVSTTPSETIDEFHKFQTESRKGILRNKAKSTNSRRDRLGTLIEYSNCQFENDIKNEPPKSKKRNTFHVTFKDMQTRSSLAKIVEVESYKKYNRDNPETKQC